MRIYLQLLFLTLTYYLSAQNIIVNPAGAPESAFNAELLTSDVLISGEGCSTSISNFELKDNPSNQYPSTNKSWGYFQKGNSDFPFESGIVLTSGKATDARGPNGPTSSYGINNDWGGEQMLTNISGYPTRNANVFEFDFVPYSEEISFRYIFASNEYTDDFGEGYECSGYNDVFAFVISGPGIVNDPGINGKNIALLPNGDPVTIDNVNGIPGCGDDTYFVHIDNNSPPINYNGMTTALTATSQVIPGQTYHIRLMVADAVDYQYDSAVFLEAGSFNLGSTLTDENGVELGDEQIVCGVEEYTLNVIVDNPMASIKWYLDDEEIPGETSSSLTVTESGTYTVGVSLVADCEEQSSVEILFKAFPVASDYQEAIKCTTGSSEIFDLREYESFISTADMVYTYYNTFDGADTDDPNELINTPANFPVIGIVEVFVRVQNADGCHVVAKLTLEASQIPTTQPKSYAVCDDNGDGIAEFDLNSYNSEIVTSDLQDLIVEYYSDSNLENLITTPENYTNTESPQIQVVYAKAYYLNSNEICFETEELTLIVNEFPEIQDWTMPLICDNLNDNSEIIDLTQNELIITQGIDVSLHYFPSLNDLNNGTQEILDPENYEFSGNPTEIHVSVENNGLNCKDNVILTLESNQAPDALDYTWESCSVDGTFQYHLPDVNSEINPDTTESLDFSYYISYNDAFDGDSPIDENYTNISSDEIIYVRIQNENGCFNISEINLITTQLVHETLTQVLEVCDDPLFESDEIAEFDLTEMDEIIRNQFGGITYTVKYYTTLQRAQDNTDEIPNPNQFENTIASQTIYARVFDGENACIGTAEFMLQVNPVPVFELDPSVTFCENDIKRFEFEEQFDSYIWMNSNGEVISSQNNVTFPQGGFYTLEVTSGGFDCPASRQIEVIIEQAPVISEIKINENLVTVNVIGNGPFQYSYDNGLTWSNSNTFSNFESGIFKMLVKSENGCVSEGKIFGVLGIPNFISPNGDGYNDYFTIRGLEAYADAHIKIFDRYGKIFVDRKMTHPFQWDGKYGGRQLPSGTYWYIITVEDKSLSGHITIKNQ